AGNLGGIGSWFLASLLPFGDSPGASAGRAGAALAMSPVVAVVVAAVVRRFRAASGERLPHVRAATLGLLGAVDWGVAIAVFVFCGRAVEAVTGTGPPVSGLMRTMTFGHAVGFVSMIPGGLGSADAVWLKLLVSYGSDPSEA